MTQDEKVALLARHLSAAGLPPGFAAPPLYRWLWRFGWRVPPPLFWGYWRSVLLYFLLFILGFSAALAPVVAIGWAFGAVGQRFLFFSLLSVAAMCFHTGARIAGMFRNLSKRLGLGSWETFPDS